ncbi:MAG: hypothetical protein JKY30_09955 [Flavobacteriales bacterium]|nr:hypothetical protein [Flavobacteriales bacterium]
MAGGIKIPLASLREYQISIPPFPPSRLEEKNRTSLLSISVIEGWVDVNPSILISLTS